MARSRIRPFLLTSALGLASVVFALPVRATPQEISLPVSVNRVAKGQTPVLLEGERVAMRISDLESYGISGAAWQRLLNFSRISRPTTSIDGGEAVWIESLSPLVRCELDPETLSLEMTVDTRLLGKTSISVRDPRPPGIIYTRDRTAFLNYAINSVGLEKTTVFGETGIGTSKGLLYSTFLRNDGPVIRGMTNFIIDHPRQLRRITIGDAYAATSDRLGGSALLSGVTATRLFNLDPYFIRYPTTNLTGTALTPSRVDVYVNGVLTTQQNVPPGPFELRNVQLSPGAGTMQVVVRDAFGNEQVQSPLDFYYSINVLARGLSEYVYSAGVLRQQFGRRSFDTGDPAGLAFHRFGLTDTFTAGARAEVSNGLWSAGPFASMTTRAGDFALSLAASGSHGETGSAGDLTYSYVTRRMSFGAQYRATSDEYANLSLSRAADRPLRDASVFASLATKFGNLSLQYRTAAMRGSADVDRRTLLASVLVRRGVSLATSVSSVREVGERHMEYFAGASFSVGLGTTASAGFASQPGDHQSTFSIQKSLPVGTGFGYQFDTLRTGDGSNTGTASVQYQSPFGRYEISGDPYHSDSKPSVLAAGGLVLAGGTLKATPPVQESFALVRIPGVEGVHVYASNQLIGRTDGRGNLLVPNLLAYYGNALRIDDRDIPMDYEIDATERTVAPPYRAGGVVTFPVRQHRSVRGTLTVAAGSTTTSPALGTLTLTRDGNSWESPIGRGGEFEFEDLASGSYEAKIEYKEGICRFTVTIPETAVANIGHIVCRSQ